MKNIPERIYLALGPDGKSARDFDELGEVTWCRDRIDPGDIEYVRAKRHKLPWAPVQSDWEKAETRLGTFEVYRRRFLGENQFAFEFRGLKQTEHPTLEAAKEAAQKYFNDLLYNPLW